MDPVRLGSITWNGSKFTCDPDTRLLQSIVNDTILGEVNGQMQSVTANDGAVFINSLCRNYNGSALWVSEPVADNEGWTPVGK
jgi:hypothetical protein